MHQEHDPHLKDRVQRLLRFLRELVKARSKPVLDVNRHEDVVWLSGDAIEVAMVRDAGAGDVMLRSARVTLPDPPKPPRHLAGRIRGDVTDSSVVPTLDRAAGDGAADFDSWLRDWTAWAAVDRDRRPLWILHNALQKSAQELAARPESVELVLASGLLSMPSSGSSPSVRTHIVTQPVVVERDEASGDLLVRLAPESAPRLEDTQLLTGMALFDPTGTRSQQESLGELASPIDAGMQVFLKGWAERSLTESVEVEGNESGARATRTLTVAPALVLRKRGSFALVEYYDRMLAEAERDDVAVPLGLAQLVEAIETEDRIAWLDRTTTTSTAMSSEPLFPLPANPEQSAIIERLARDSGVVVEGPPGTGKTHTIANLVSALLAQGQRVLVTSEKAQALRVLRDKLPPEVQELCVAITDVGRGGSTELNRSVAEIATRKSSYNPTAVNVRIADLTARRDHALGQRANLTDQIRRLREGETVVHDDVAVGYGGTAAAIVRKVTAHRDRLDWLPGPVATIDPVLSGNEFRTLVDLQAQSTPERRMRLSQTFPSTDALLPPLADLRQLCARATAVPPPLRQDASWLTDVLAGATGETLAEVRARCESLKAAVVEMRHQPPAVQPAADRVLSGSAGHLWARTTGIAALLEAAAKSDSFVGARIVTVPSTGRPAFDAFSALATAMRSGTEWRGRLFKSDQQKAVEALGPLATVDGAPATTAESVQVVAEHLRAIGCVEQAAAILADLGVGIDVSGSRAFQVNALANASQSLARVDELLRQVDRTAEYLRAMNPTVPPIRSIDAADALADAATSIAVSVDIADARAALDRLAASVSQLAADRSPETQVLAEVLRSSNYEHIEAALAAIDEARTVQRDEQSLVVLMQRLTDAAPALAALVADGPSDPDWDARSHELDEAWAWQRARQWVGDRDLDGVDRRLETELGTVEKDIAQLTSQLAAERAWRECLERMTASQVQALQAYRGHVASIGKGTGQYAEKFRAAARSAMREAQGAVPAWVMPLQQVLASIPPEPGAFDVVIVDEASQADISSLFLLWLAPRVIVVGDDKQCAPSEVASGSLDSVFQKLDSFLPDMPDYLRASLTPRDSLFSMLRTRFGQVVRLREHFRCMPEIINWSSSQFYADAPLVPLRQFGADRLAPLRTTHVEGAEVTGKDTKVVNRVEAAAIADAIERCLDDPAYDGKTFGVVVLQGQGQVDEIANVLLERIDGRVWDERRLRVGTPPDFQGDERHVVFLSMVIAPGYKSSARTDNKAQRAFNVAASRAQDQLWLFHSVASESLSNIDLRHSLLTYMQSTSPDPADPMPTNVTVDDRHSAFDSLFEQQVYLDVVEHGYHVNPQTEVNGRRIDLVVTGGAGKIAVECDGDAFTTTPEQRERDLERERELKRCGWEFWRVRESAYYLDPVGAMTGLWQELGRRGIAPSPALRVDTPRCHDSGPVPYGGRASASNDGVASTVEVGCVRWQPTTDETAAVSASREVGGQTPRIAPGRLVGSGAGSAHSDLATDRDDLRTQDQDPAEDQGAGEKAPDDTRGVAWWAPRVWSVVGDAAETESTTSVASALWERMRDEDVPRPPDTSSAVGHVRATVTDHDHQPDISDPPTNGSNGAAAVGSTDATSSEVSDHPVNVVGFGSAWEEMPHSAIPRGPHATSTTPPSALISGLDFSAALADLHGLATSDEIVDLIGTGPTGSTLDRAEVARALSVEEDSALCRYRDRGIEIFERVPENSGQARVLLEIATSPEAVSDLGGFIAAVATTDLADLPLSRLRALWNAVALVDPLEPPRPVTQGEDETTAVKWTWKGATTVEYPASGHESKGGNDNAANSVHDRVLTMAAVGPLTSKGVASSLKLDHPVVVAALYALVAQGKLTKVDRKHGATYVLVRDGAVK